MEEIVKFEFQGDVLDCVKDGEDLWVSVRRMCEPLGIDHDNQRVKLKNKSWARTVLITARDANGRNQRQFFLHVDSVPMWLATIDENRVSVEVRPKLQKYQKEVAKALRDYFFTGRAVRGPVMPSTLIEAGELWLVALKEAAAEKEGRVLAEAKIQKDEPKVAFADDIGACTKSIPIGDFAKMLNNGDLIVGRNGLFFWLKEHGYLMWDNKPYQRYVDNGWFVLIEKVRETDNGPVPWCQTRITGRGQVQMSEKIRKSGDFKKRKRQSDEAL